MPDQNRRLRWGPGIYSSPDGPFTLHYGRRKPGDIISIFLCAVARGKAFTLSKVRGRKFRGLQPGYDSSVCPMDHEWIVFDESRIIPLCVLAVRTGVLTHGRYSNLEGRAFPGCGKLERYYEIATEMVSAGIRRPLYQHLRKDGWGQIEQIELQRKTENEATHWY